MTPFIRHFLSPSSPPHLLSLSPSSTTTCPPPPSHSSTTATSSTTLPPSFPLSPITMTMTRTYTTSTFMPHPSPLPSPTASLYYLFTTPLCIIAPFLTAAPSPTSRRTPTLPTALTYPIPTCTLLSTTTPLHTTAHTCLRNICITLRILASAALLRSMTLAFTRPRPRLHFSLLCTTFHVPRITHHIHLPCPLPSHRVLPIPSCPPSYSPTPQNSAELISRRVSPNPLSCHCSSSPQNRSAIKRSITGSPSQVDPCAAAFLRDQLGEAKWNTFCARLFERRLGPIKSKIRVRGKNTHDDASPPPGATAIDFLVKVEVVKEVLRTFVPYVCSPLFCIPSACLRGWITLT